MAEYTPEPYELIVGGSSTQIHSSDGVIAEFSCCDHEANARRWLACASSCKGISTERLECGCLGWLHYTIGSLDGDYTDKRVEACLRVCEGIETDKLDQMNLIVSRSK